MENTDKHKRYLASDSDILNDPTVESQFEPTSNRSQSVLDRIGGMDGFMTIVGQFQQAYGLYKQMRPTFQLVSTFIGPKAMIKNVNHKKNRSRRRTNIKTVNRRK